MHEDPRRLVRRGTIFLAKILARMSVRDARVYTCTRLQTYTIGASLMSVSMLVSVSVPWNSSFKRQAVTPAHLDHK